MDDAVTRLPIWLALGAYGVSVIALAANRGAFARWAYTAGLVCFLIHVAAAFHFHYGWSHEVAMNETDQRTRQMTGLEMSGGLYANYLFTLVWILDAASWWIVGNSRYQSRNRFWEILLHGLFAFMIFNGAIVFAGGPVRVVGVIVLLTVGSGLAWRWTRGERTCPIGESLAE